MLVIHFQHLIYLLHLNELPLRHLLKELYGATKGPDIFSGSIGKLLVDCISKPIHNFIPISNTVSEFNISLMTLSKDQKYLYKMCHIINDGNCPDAMANAEPGHLSPVRWLTTADRILRVCVYFF